MEASLLHLSTLCDAELSGDPHASEDPDLQTVEYLNGMLMEEDMEEGTEDSTCMQQEAETSYRSILSSFYGVLGECLPPDSASNSAIIEGMPDLHMPRKSMSPHETFGISFAHPIGPCVKIRHSEQPNVVLSSLTRDIHDIGVLRAVNGDSHKSFKQGMPVIPNTNLGVAHGLFSGFINIAHQNSLGIAQLSADSAVLKHCGDFELSNARRNQEQGRGNFHTSFGQRREEIPFIDYAVPQDSFSLAFAIAHQSPPGTVHEQGTGNFKTLSRNANTMFKSVNIHVSFEEFKLTAGYTDLYAGRASTSASCARSIGLNGHKNKSSTGAFQGSKSQTIGSTGIFPFLDTTEALVNCAQAVSLGDVKKAREILHELYRVHGASPNGNAFQRIAYYFSEALISRLGGVGMHLHRCRAMCETVHSAGIFLRALKVGYEVGPYLKIMHFLANQNILKAAEGASRLHIVSYGEFYGMQWPCLINALADRKGGPPLLVITCIDFSQRDHDPAEQPEETGRRLAAYARTYNVPFEYHAIVADKWEDIDLASITLHKNEILVVNCLYWLHYIADESVMNGLTISPRQKFLTSMRGLNPHLLLTSHIHARFSSPFFVSRFREALYYYSNTFDMLETVWSDNPDRLFIERSSYALDIRNVVACEGAERVQRPETYQQWDLRMKRAGFKQLPISAAILSRPKAHVKQQYHKDFTVCDDKGWILLGWKGHTKMAWSAWRPIPL